MLLKLRFKNHSCFQEWQQINLMNYNLSLEKLVGAKVASILGDSSCGKSSVIKLLNTTIGYLKHFLNYDNESKITDKFNSITNVINPYIFSLANTNSDENKVSNFDSKDVLMVKKDDLIFLNDYQISNTSVELELTNQKHIFKYELSFNYFFPEYEKLSYRINENKNDAEWIILYDKKNVTFDIIEENETCLFDIYVNNKELNLTNDLSFVHINKKNSLISYIKSVSKSDLLIEFEEIYKSIEFIMDTDLSINFKSFNIDKKYLDANKQRFVNAFKTMGFNIVDFYINDIDLNSFTLSIGKLDENNNIFYLNSKFESTTVIKLFHLLYKIFVVLDKKQILIIDNFEKYLNFNSISYLLDLFNKQNEINNKNDAQIIFTLNSIFENDLLGISQSNSKIEIDNYSSKIKRID